MSDEKDIEQEGENTKPKKNHEKDEKQVFILLPCQK